MSGAGGHEATSGRGDVRGYAWALVGIAAVSLLIALVSRRGALPDLALLYLLVVLAVAIRHGRRPAFLAAVAAFLANDYFFVGTPGQVTIFRPGEGPTHWLSLLLFLATAAVTGQLAATARRRAAEAERHAREARLLYEVAELTGPPASVADLERALPAVADRLRRALGLAAVAIELAHPEPGAAGGLTARSPDVAGADGTDPPGAEEAIAIRVDGRVLGTLRARRPSGLPPFDEAECRLLATVAAQLGLAAERVRLRREELAAEMLRRTDEVKSALLAAVSHQLRTPLAAIVTAAGTLQEDAPWAVQDRRAIAATIEGEARRLNRIVTNLLDLSRIESGALRPQRGWYDLGALVDEALERLRPVATGHRLAVAMPDDLPPLPLDYVQIEQVLVNLVENAAKYAPAGTTIRVEAERAGDTLVVTVADRGPGFPPAALPHLFTPFYRAVAPGSGPHGAGLGLAVVKGLVEAHGGRVWAENAPGGGARVSFTLPLAADAPAGEAGQGAEAGRPRERVA